MKANRRKGIVPVPANLDNHLSQAQLVGLHKAEGYGWSVKFVRRATVVLVYKDGVALGVLEGDGTLNRQEIVHERTEEAPGTDDPKDSRPRKFII